MESAWQDVRYAWRLLRNSPLFTTSAALSLAIGIGANATIFSVANALLFRSPVGIADHSRVVDVGRTSDGRDFDTVSYLNYVDIRDRVTTLSGLYAYEIEPNAMSLGGTHEAERIYGAFVSANYFDVLGTRPVMGRLLHPADDANQQEPVAVIAHGLWQRRFNSDPTVIGSAVVLNGARVTIVGVAPPGFQGTTLLRADVWVPIGASPLLNPRRADILTSRFASWLFMGGRLAPGVSLQQARAELGAIGEALKREYPQTNREITFTATSHGAIPGRMSIIAGFVGVLMALVSLVLFIACVNVAGMLLARAAARRREIAVRLAIGAGRARLIRQLLTETMVLFLIGAVAGLILSKWLAALLLSLLPEIPVPVALSLVIDWRVVAFTAAVSMVAAILAGLAPALQGSRADLVSGLKTEGLDGGPSRLRLRNAFVVGQVTMSLLLVIVAGLFLRSLNRAADAQPGFDQYQVDVATLDLSLARYDETTGLAFMRDLLSRLRALPGVQAVTASVDLPLDGGRFGLGSLRHPGSPSDDPAGRIDADWNVVEPGWFQTLRVPLRGRDFTPADSENAPTVVIVNEAFARRAWPGEDALGKRIDVQTGLRGARRTATVVGVAADAKLIWLSGTVEPYVYAPLAQNYMARLSVLVRRGEATAIPQVRDVMRQMNPNLPLTEALTLEEVTAIGLVPQRVAASVAGSLGTVGLLLAAMGIYGVTAYAVARRTREIGIRVALGADSATVLRLVLRQGFVLAGIGIVLGVSLAALGARFLEWLLFGIGALDPATFISSCVLFAIVTLVATYIPARAATRVDPITALRAE
jgi:predicted permease